MLLPKKILWPLIIQLPPYNFLYVYPKRETLGDKLVRNSLNLLPEAIPWWLTLRLPRLYNGEWLCKRLVREKGLWRLNFSLSPIKWNALTENFVCPVPSTGPSSSSFYYTSRRLEYAIIVSWSCMLQPESAPGKYLSQPLLQLFCRKRISKKYPCFLF